MIDFILKSETTNYFGKLLTFEQLNERRLNSPKGELLLWGFLTVSKGKFYKTSRHPFEIFLYSEGDVRRFIFGNTHSKSTKDRAHLYDRYIAFTKREKVEEIYKKSIHRGNVKNFTPDKSTFFTEVYD